MKMLYTFISMLFIASLSQAQIPNASFEHWTNGTPNGWHILGTAGEIVQSTNSHDSTYAARFNVLDLDGINDGGYLWSGDSGTDSYIPLASIPAALNGWFIANFVDSDQMTINAVVTANSLVVGQIGTTFLENTSVYKQFSFSFDTSNVIAGPDSSYIEFGMGNFSQEGAGALDTSSYYIIDELSMGPLLNVGAGIAQLNVNAILEQCSPNPASSNANIIYTIANHSTVTLTLYDVVGHKVRTLLENMVQTPGRYKVPTDVSELPSGVYFYSLNVDGETYTQKLVVSK